MRLIFIGRKDSRKPFRYRAGLSTDVIDVGHVVGFTPQAKFREVYYARGLSDTSSQHRETFWAAMDATSKLSRRFHTGSGEAMLHTIEPSVIYEYVPSDGSVEHHSNRSGRRSPKEESLDLYAAQPAVGTRRP